MSLLFPIVIQRETQEIVQEIFYGKTTFKCQILFTEIF